MPSNEIVNKALLTIKKIDEFLEEFDRRLPGLKPKRENINAKK